MNGMTILKQNTNRRASFRQSLQQNCYRYKFTVALTITIWTLIYLLSYKNLTRPDSNPRSEQFIEGSQELVDILRNELGVVAYTDNSSPPLCPAADRTFVVAIPGMDIYAFVWEYLSLLAIKQRLASDINQQKFNVYLSWKSRTALSQVFDNIAFKSVTEIDPRCYALETAEFLSSTAPINLSTSRSSVFILRRNTKRYRDIIASNLNALRQQIVFNSQYRGTAEQELSLTQIRLGILPGSSVEEPSIVGIYMEHFDKDTLQFVIRARNFVRKMHSDALFLVICSNVIMDECFEQLKFRDTRIIPKSSEYETNLAILAQCNHTIAINELGILSALINGGTTVLNRGDVETSPLKRIMDEFSENMLNWYMIA